ELAVRVLPRLEDVLADVEAAVEMREQAERRVRVAEEDAMAAREILHGEREAEIQLSDQGFDGQHDVHDDLDGYAAGALARSPIATGVASSREIGAGAGGVGVLVASAWNSGTSSSNAERTFATSSPSVHSWRRPRPRSTVSHA